MISILIPIYNGIEFLEESLNSVIKQTYKEWEVIIGINGHIINSDVYIKAKKFENDKIKVLDFYMINGKSKTLNEMVKFTKYNWIAILDVDDKWTPRKLELQIKLIKDYNVIGTGCQYFGTSNSTPKIPYGDLKNFDFLNFNPIINSSVILKKELAYWNIEYDILEDYELWLRLKKKEYKFFNIKSILTFHRLHKESYFNNNIKQSEVLINLKEKYK